MRIGSERCDPKRRTISCVDRAGSALDAVAEAAETRSTSQESASSDVRVSSGAFFFHRSIRYRGARLRWMKFFQL